MRNKIGIVNLICGAFMALGLSFLVTSCVKDDLGAKGGRQPGVSTIELNILTNNEVVTRATTPTTSEERFVNNGFVFVFNADGSQKSYYVLRPDLDIENNGNVQIKLTAFITFVTGDKVAVVFNRSLTEAELLNVTLNNIDDLFPLGSTGFEDVADLGLPMYGVHTIVDPTLVAKIDVKRPVAKLQVMINSTVTGDYSADFTTANVTYQIVNNAINGKMTQSSTVGGINASETNQAPAANIADDRITRLTSETTSDNKGASYIYEYEYSTNIIGEASSTSIDINTSAQNRLAIILKTTSGRFYRLDLVRKEGDKYKYLDILRNHHYKIIINSVRDAGFTSALAALEGAPSNIEYVIEDNIGDITISNGEYAISVGEQLLAGKIVETTATKLTFDLATNVRYILAGVVDVPTTNSITIVDDKGAVITGASVSSTLTATAKTISITLLKGENIPSIKFKIVLGELEFLSEPFSVAYLFSDEEVGETVDCYILNTTHDATLYVASSEYKNIAGKIVLNSENVTPIRWEVMNGFGDYVASEESNVDAIPIFMDKFTVLERIDGGTPVIIRQLAPIYVGRYGSPIDGSDVKNYARLNGPIGEPLRKRAIIHVRETDPVRHQWTETYNLSVTKRGIYHVNNGLAISTYRLLDGDPHIGSQSENFALNHCYKKNGSGVVKWYLPAQQQLMGLYIVSTAVGYGGPQSFVGDAYYWSSSELDGYLKWGVYFDIGRPDASNHLDGRRIRCIRDL